MTTLYGIPNCDTMKKARAWLEEAGLTHDFHDYKTAGIAPAKLQAWVRQAGWEALLNRAGTTFRKLPDDQKQGLDEARAMALMGAELLFYPTAIGSEPYDIDLDTSRTLVEKIPSDFVKISESGISNAASIVDLKTYGYQGFLVGENFMKTENPGASAAAFIKTIEDEA